MRLGRWHTRTLLVFGTAISVVAPVLGSQPATAAGPVGTPSAAPALAGQPAVPASGALFGAAVSARPQLDVKSSVTRLEGQIGRKFAVHRLYDVWDDAQPRSLTTWTLAGGRTPVLSIKASRRNGTVVRWADIASGREDAAIREQARGLRALNAPLFLALHHEPENDPAHGSASDYANAWRHYVTVFRAEGVRNVSFTWILMAWSFARPSIADAFYPGDDVIDWVAADGYNWYGTAPGKDWRSLVDGLSAFNAWNAPHRKPMMVAEYGTLEDAAVPGRKASWIGASTAALKTMPGIKAVLYFHSPVTHPWWVDTSPSSLAAFAAMGRDLYYGAAGGRGPNPVADFDGDGATDLAVYRPSTGGWYVRGVRSATWGVRTDLPVPADYNGDGRAEVAIWRPTDGRWYVERSASVPYGLAGDVPVPGDYNGDGRAEFAIWRPSTGAWWIRGGAAVSYGLRGDVPVPADYNGDGRTDLAVYRPATGTWWIRGAASVTYGLRADVPVPGDYNGDGRSDVAIWRPSTGGWWVRGAAPIRHGGYADVPVPGDYDADGSTDLAVYGPGTGTWSVAGRAGIVWGLADDQALPLPPAIRGHYPL